MGVEAFRRRVSLEGPGGFGPEEKPAAKNENPGPNCILSCGFKGHSIAIPFPSSGWRDLKGKIAERKEHSAERGEEVFLAMRLALCAMRLVIPARKWLHIRKLVFPATQLQLFCVF